MVRRLKEIGLATTEEGEEEKGLRLGSLHEHPRERRSLKRVCRSWAYLASVCWTVHRIAWSFFTIYSLM